MSTENTIIDQIHITYPKMYDAVKDLVLYDERVYLHIADKYGKDTLENIIHTNKYHKELENASNGTTSNSKWNKLAHKRHPIFQRYLNETSAVSRVAGFKQTLEMMDILERHFKQLAPILT